MRLIANRPLSISPTRKVRLHEEFEIENGDTIERYLRRGDARLADGETLPVAKAKKPAKRKAPRTKRPAKPKPETSDLPALEPDAQPAE